jgi:hypothetical protein
MTFSLIAPSVSPRSGAGQPNTQAPLGLTAFCVYCAANFRGRLRMTYEA